MKERVTAKKQKSVQRHCDTGHQIAIHEFIELIVMHACIHICLFISYRHNHIQSFTHLLGKHIETRAYTHTQIIMNKSLF